MRWCAAAHQTRHTCRVDHSVELMVNAYAAMPVTARGVQHHVAGLDALDSFLVQLAGRVEPVGISQMAHCVVRVTSPVPAASSRDGRGVDGRAQCVPSNTEELMSSVHALALGCFPKGPDRGAGQPREVGAGHAEGRREDVDSVLARVSGMEICHREVDIARTADDIARLTEDRACGGSRLLRRRSAARGGRARRMRAAVTELSNAARACGLGSLPTAFLAIAIAYL